MDLSAPEIRVLGCLLEKQRTTPDAYPLSLNALRLACNQATNRDPVTEYDEAVIRDALHRLSRRRWARLASGAGSRAPKYRHLLDEALGLPEDELAVLCVLMLRGPQTPGELKQRTERLHALADLAAVLDALERLIGRDLAERLPRRPGQKEERYAHLLADDDAPVAPAAPGGPAAQWTPPPAAAAPVEDAAQAPPPPPASAAPAAAPAPDPRVARLEDEVAALRAELAALRASLDALRADLGA
ncbi:MAG TPA: YceH family protein [Solirubrobacteraceae bacterium]